MSKAAEYPGSGTFPRGLHPADNKSLAADSPIGVLPTPPTVRIPLWQHTGAAAVSLVNPPQEVAMGDLIGEAQGFVSAGVHASVSGTVQAESMATLPTGRHVPVIPIAAGKQPLEADALWRDTYGGDWPKRDVSGFASPAIADAVRQAGIVGMGGAAFPTHVKLVHNDAKPIDTIIINACECESYLTADDRLIRQAVDSIVCGALLAAQAQGAERIFIAIEDNKPVAIESIRRTIRSTRIQLAIVPTKYPMGGERQIIPAITGRTVPTAGLPLEVGVVVINVATAAAIARAVVRGKPLTHRVVSVSGSGITKPRNLLVPIGASYRALIDNCGGLRHEAARVVSGGPMMGFAVSANDLDSPVTKGTSGITVLLPQDVGVPEETRCIRCGRCVDVCPLKLVPTKAALAARDGDWDQARRYNLMACCECGCCAYICPAGIPLTQLLRMGKALMPKTERK